MKPLALAFISLSLVASAKDSLSNYLTRDREQRTPTKDIRLAYVIVRVPMTAMAGAISEDKGDDPDHWQRKLDEWEKSGTLEIIEPHSSLNRLDLKNDVEWKQGYGTRPWQFIGVGAAATHWYGTQEARERNLPPPDQNDLLQDLSEHSIGLRVRALAKLCPDGRRVDLSFTLSHTSDKPDKRPTTTWPIPPFDASRLFFRSWSLVLDGRFAMNQTVLLGTQMEPPRDGEFHTGHMLAAFARIYPPTAESNASGALNDDTPGVRVQSWTLAVPQEIAMAWLKSRSATTDDGGTFSDWLKLGMSHEGVELLSASAMSGRSGAEVSAEAKLEWNDAGGFEPAGTHTEFRPRPCECQDYSRTYETKINIHSHTDDGAAADGRSFWQIRSEIQRPAVAARWLKWKTAMERDESDPNALEIAEAGPRDEAIDSLINFSAGRVSMIGAAMNGGRVHVTFQRIIEDRATGAATRLPAKGVPSSPMLALWMIETPLDWQRRLLTADRASMNKLGTELLATAGKNDVRLVGHLSATHRIDQTRPSVFPGGAYVNTAPGPAGIFFNHRMVECEAVGDRMEIELDDAATRALHLHVTSLGPPEWCRWGIWQPHVEKRSAENSGVDLPVFPRAEIDGRWIIEPGEVSVIAALRVARPFAKATVEPCLRWYVARLDADHEPASGWINPDGRVGRGLPSWQITVLRVADSSSLAEDESAAARLLADAGNGTVEILELATVHGGDLMKATAGSDMRFTDGRISKDILADSEVMLPGTRWNDQIDYNHRVAGLQLEGDVRAGTWKLTHDEEPPKIVTDTFDDAGIEWPEPLNWDVPRKIEHTTVNVQRPIFHVTTSAIEADLPKPGEMMLKHLSKTAVLIVRRLK